MEDLDLDLALIELNDYMTTKIKKPFNFSALLETINSTQDKLLLEHKSLEELQINVDSFHKIKTISKFNFNPMHALNEQDTLRSMQMYNITLKMLHSMLYSYWRNTKKKKYAKTTRRNRRYS